VATYNAGLPWLGPVWAVDATSVFLTFQKWAQKYGSVYQVTIFGQHFAVVSDPNIAKDLLAKQGALCADRPSIALIDNSKESGKYLPFLGNNGTYMHFLSHDPPIDISRCVSQAA
jgi:hypothetical protein